MKDIFDINLISIIVLSLLSIVAIKYKISKYYRVGLLITSLVYIGFYLKECICPIGAFQYLAIDFRNIFSKDNLNFLLLFIVPIIFTIFFGRIYCSTVCPMGAYQELLFKLGKKLKINNGNSSLGKFKILVYFKYFFMVTIIVFSVITGVAVFCGFDPFFSLFNFSGTTLSFILLGLVTIVSLFKPRLWCRIICPYGALLGITSLMTNVFSKKTKVKLGAPVIGHNCKNCKLCNKSCIVGAIENKSIDSSECISCGNCKKVCKFDSIK